MNGWYNIIDRIDKDKKGIKNKVISASWMESMQNLFKHLRKYIILINLKSIGLKKFESTVSQ